MEVDGRTHLIKEFFHLFNWLFPLTLLPLNKKIRLNERVIQKVALLMRRELAKLKCYT